MKAQRICLLLLPVDALLQKLLHPHNNFRVNLTFEQRTKKPSRTNEAYGRFSDATIATLGDSINERQMLRYCSSGATSPP